MKKIFLLFSLLCNLTVFAEVKFEPVTDEVRDNYLKRAQVWKPTDIPNMDIAAGPQNEVSVRPGTEVRCEYVEVKKGLSGKQPKFLCKTESGQIVRVKYGKDTMEIYADVVATRLLWALGFYADEVYPAKVVCLNCPEKDPSGSPEDQKRADLVFESAIIERNFRGTTIEESEDEGWNWSELDKVDEKEGAPLNQRDALKLLMVFIQHADTKADNQRLACYREDIADPDGDAIGTCEKPVLMIQDLGSTFGGGLGGLHLSKTNFKDWERKPVWNATKQAKYMAENKVRPCFGNLTPSKLSQEESMDDPFISEEGRKFLAGLLNQLTNQQILDLFRVAGVERLHQFVEDNGVQRRITAEDWAAVFVKKRAEINKAECTSVLKEK